MKQFLPFLFPSRRIWHTENSKSIHFPIKFAAAYTQKIWSWKKTNSQNSCIPDSSELNYGIIWRVLWKVMPTAHNPGRIQASKNKIHHNFIIISSIMGTFWEILAKLCWRYGVCFSREYWTENEWICTSPAIISSISCKY